MSLAIVYDYFSNKLNAVDCVEIDESYNPEIASTIIDRSYFQTINGVSGGDHSNKTIETTVSHEVRIHFKGFREPRNAEREALEKAETIVGKCVAVKNMIGDFQSVRGVYFRNLTLIPLNEETNDSIIVAILNFDVRIFICME